MWSVVLLAGVAALVAVAWKASRRGRRDPKTGTGGPDTFFAGEGSSHSDDAASDCADSTSDSGGCDGGGDGGGD